MNELTKSGRKDLASRIVLIYIKLLHYPFFLYDILFLSSSMLTLAVVISAVISEGSVNLQFLRNV